MSELLDAFEQCVNELEVYINERYDGIAPIGMYGRLDRERTLELEFVARCRGMIADNRSE